MLLLLLLLYIIFYHFYSKFDYIFYFWIISGRLQNKISQYYSKYYSRTCGLYSLTRCRFNHLSTIYTFSGGSHKVTVVSAVAKVNILGLKETILGIPFVLCRMWFVLDNITGLLLELCRLETS